MIVVMKFRQAGKLRCQIKIKSNENPPPLIRRNAHVQAVAVLDRSPNKLTRSRAHSFPQENKNRSRIPFRTIPSHPKDPRGFQSHFLRSLPRFLTNPEEPSELTRAPKASPRSGRSQASLGLHFKASAWFIEGRREINPGRRGSGATLPVTTVELRPLQSAQRGAVHK